MGTTVGVINGMYFGWVIDAQERQALLFLAGVEGIGREKLQLLLEWREQTSISLCEVVDCPTLSPVLQRLPKVLEKIAHFKEAFSPESYERWLEDEEITTVCCFDPEYPLLLRETSKPPVILYLRGDSSVLQRMRPIAIVGTRQATGYGARATRTIVSELVAHDATIVSGFMYGIDAMAHETAIRAGGTTAAVLGFGFGQMYPPNHQILFDRWVNHPGVLFVSQFRPNTIAKPGNFPARNHVVAGLSLATVVIEAASESGTMITVAAALEEGRAVCAVPGPFDNPYSEGTKYLINQGATLVRSGSDVLSEISAISGVMTASGTQVPQTELSAAQQQIFDSIKSGVSVVDELLAQVSLDAIALNRELTELELLGVIRRTQVGWELL